MPNTITPFEERLYTEYDLKGRVKLAIIISMILFVSFLLLDWVYTPQHIKTFAIIRFSVAALEFLLLVIAKRTKTHRGFLNLAMTMVILDAVGIGIMIQILGGFLTSYYQGLNIIVMGMIVVIPFAFREAIFLYVLTWAIYAVPSFLKIAGGQAPIVLNGESLDLWRFVTNNLFFLTSIIIVGAVGSHSMDSTRRRELRSRTQLEETTAKLQESNIKLKSLDELKTQFFANVNHELRTPLTLMLAPLKAILENRMGKLSAQFRDTLETMQRNGYKLLKLINNLLDLTKLEEGKMRLKIKPVNLVEFTNSLLSTVKPLADQNQIKLYFQHPPHDVELVVDPDQFEKVILNLLSNALKFTPKGGKITVYIEDKDSSVTLAVEDTGIGIPANMLETIFDRFSQVDGSMSRSHEGTGIGLSLAREIVSVHGGAIRAESELGKGSRFIVDMLKGESHFPEDVLDRRQEEHPVGLKRRTTDTGEPRVQDIVADAHRLQLVDLEHVDIEGPAGEATKTHDALILAIDDNAEVLKLMKMLLSDEFDVEVATSAEKGLALMREKSPDLVLCDVMMPGMDGHAFCRTVKADAALKHMPVILVTARTGAEMLAEGMQAGADDYISKPFDSVELKARIRALLRIRRSRIRAGPGQPEPQDADLRPCRSAALAVPVHGQVPGLRHRREGRIHPPPLDPGDRLLAEDRGPDGLQRKGEGRPRAGRAPPRRRQDRRPGEHPQQAGQADGGGVRPHQGAPGAGREHPAPGHRAQGHRQGRPGPPRALRRHGLSRRVEGPGDPPRRPDHGRSRRLRLDHLAAAVPQGVVPPLRGQGDHPLLGGPVRPGGRRALPRGQRVPRPGAGRGRGPGRTARPEDSAGLSRPSSPPA